MHLLLLCIMTNKCTIISQIIKLLHVSTLSCHLQGPCNRYLVKLHKYFKCSWLQAPWGWHDSVEICRSVIICKIIVHLLVIVQKNTCLKQHNENYKLCYQQLHLKYLCNLARYWLKAPWGWRDSVETCSIVIICEIIVHLLVIIHSNKRCTVHVLN